MISWIQHHLIRHGRWIFLTLLAVIIVAFVFTIGNTPGCTTDRSGYEENLFYGVDLNSPLEADELAQKVTLSAMLNTQQFRTNEQFQGQITSRVAMLHLADEIGVPSPTQEILAEYIKTKNAFRGPEGDFSADAYTRFVDQMELNPRAPQGMVLAVLEEDFRIEQVAKALSGPGYLLPSETAAQAQRSRTELTLSVAELSYADFEPDQDSDEAALSDYFESNKQRYEIPERIKASYVLFPTEDFLVQVTAPSDSELRQHFAANRASFIESSVEETETTTFEDVRDAVVASLTAELSARVANEAAQAFAFQLYRDEITRESAAFNQLINESGLSLNEIEPYTAAGVSERELSTEMLESAFTLGGSRYYSDAYEVDGGFAVLIYEGRIAPEIPPFDAVAAEVVSDFLSEQKRRLFNEKGVSLKAELEAALSEGTSFTEAAESLGLSAQSFDTFAVKDLPAALNRSALQQAQSMSAGEVSPMLTLGGIGTFVYLENKEVPEVTADDPEIAQSKGMLERWASFTTRTDLTNELVFQGLSEEVLEEVE